MRTQRGPTARYVQLATVRSDGRPANRTVVFRGFWGPDDHRLLFATDSRSSKVTQGSVTPWGEVCAWWAQPRVQLRVLGRLRFVGWEGPEPELLERRAQQWRALRPGARASWRWPFPGNARAGDALFPAPRAELHDVQAPPEPEPTFVLVLLDPVRVDELHLKPTPHRRWFHERDETWRRREVNP
jgi:pyridoxamine 5'-phosphate oxidase